ncbi:MAG: hypothetical protein K8W52_27245 [Deltaproteobacteria bacterium]|nr:hypothetical protein [Deltaproteobacteria bacterium]
MKRALAGFVIVAVAGASARADEAWVDDHTTTVLVTRIGTATLTVRRRAMPYSSGYRYVALTAVVARDGAVVRTALGPPGPTMCDRVRAIAGGIETAVCNARYGDTRTVVRWRLDPATDHLIAGPAHDDSPYAARAAQLVGELAATGRAEAARDAAIDRLGPSPDGQTSIAWWWDAHRLLARWPVIARALDEDPDRARALLRPLVIALLAPDDDGEAGAIAAIAAGDLRVVPRTSGHPVIAGPRPELTAILVEAAGLLRGGSGSDLALADQLRAAIVVGGVRAVTAVAEGAAAGP